MSISLPNGQSSADRVKYDILNRTLSEDQGGMVRPAYFYDLVLSATAPRYRHRDPRRNYVTWTASERQALFSKIRTWWDTHGQKAVTDRRPQGLFDGWLKDAMNEVLRGIEDVVRSVLLPSVGRKSRFGKQILAFIQDLQSSGLPVGSVLPATLFVRPTIDVPSVASELRREFAHSETEFYLAALRGLRHWGDLSYDRRGRPKNFPPIPPDLQWEVGAAVATRRPGVVRLALQVSSALLDRLRLASDERFRASLVNGLDYLFTEVAYTEKSKLAGSIQPDDIPDIRVEAVRLVTVFTKLGIGDHIVIQRWIDSAKDDPLPEVRKAARVNRNDDDD